MEQWFDIQHGYRWWLHKPHHQSDTDKGTLTVTQSHHDILTATPEIRVFTLSFTIASKWVKPMSSQLLCMYNGNYWVQVPGLGLWEARTPDGLNELLELQKCDWSPGPLSRPWVRAWGPYLKSSYASCRCVPLTVQPASPDITPDAGLFMGAR